MERKGKKTKPNPLLTLFRLLQTTASKSPCSYASVTLKLSNSKYQENLIQNVLHFDIY